MNTKIMFALAALMVVLTGCWGQVNEAVKEDQQSAERQLQRLIDAQPAPEFPWSQIRQNLIEITMAQGTTTQTTSFFFNLGVENPIKSCPSIGYPIPTTAQLTSPDQAIQYCRGGERYIVPQAEQTGVYTGDSTGTYVICVSPSGEAYASYWEGFVQTESGAAEWIPGEGIVLVGDPSFDFSEGR